MKPAVFVTPAAKRDISEAYRWYKNYSLSLGKNFLYQINSCKVCIQEQPKSFPKVHQELRRALLRKFPYGIFYLIEEKRILILACLDCRRKPSHWQSRISQAEPIK